MNFAKAVFNLVIMYQVFFACVYFFVPSPAFDTTFSTVLQDAEGNILSVQLAKDEQWRFPSIDVVPDKYTKALLAFEDKRFFHHPGVDALSIARAMVSNVVHNKVRSGGSTITMQLVRMSRGKKRTYSEKIIEMFLALQLELQMTKEEILLKYTTYAPYGGNIVGLHAASWRYFGRKPGNLSWSEAATLAVLPNSPGLIHPGRNRKSLFDKKNALLLDLLQQNAIDSITYALAVKEAVPENPSPFPTVAKHLMYTSIKEKGRGHLIASTISAKIQERTESIAKKYAMLYSEEHINNVAILIADNSTGAILAYCGNVELPGIDNAKYVDMVPAQRSSGSTLKPFLYAGLVTDGKMMPQQMVPDVPSYFSGFSPENFHKSYEGLVAADKALARSLNVPAVHMLQNYGHLKFNNLLKTVGFSTITNSADHYGLSVILGGAEVNLRDLVGGYMALSRNGPVELYVDKLGGKYTYDAPFNNFAQEATLNALKEAFRPLGERHWKNFEGSKKIAWKTGTSIGHKDAWSIGVDQKYTVGVWVGNADGEGRPGLTGARKAAPIMFEVFRSLPNSKWFDFDKKENKSTTFVCGKTGFIANEACRVKKRIQIPESSLKNERCPYHSTLFLNTMGKRVDAKCWPSSDLIKTSWFLIPPMYAHYYKFKDPEYKELPPFESACAPLKSVQSMGFIYPKNGTQIYIPTSLDGVKQRFVAEVATKKMDEKLYWHLDDHFLTTTYENHKIEVLARFGTHSLTVVSEGGDRIQTVFKVLSE